VEVFCKYEVNSVCPPSLHRARIVWQRACGICLTLWSMLRKPESKMHTTIRSLRHTIYMFNYADRLGRRWKYSTKGQWRLKNTASRFYTVKINTLYKALSHIYSILLCALGLNTAETFNGIKTDVNLCSITPLGEGAADFLARGPYFQPWRGNRIFHKSMFQCLVDILIHLDKSRQTNHFQSEERNSEQ
jgi:hypothetical protein